MYAALVRTAKRPKKKWNYFFMALPFIVFVLFFHYVPLFGWYLAFIDYEVGKPILQCDFIGLKNFSLIFTNQAFSRALSNTLIYSSIKYLLLFTPPIFAILFHEIDNNFFRKLVQTASTLPHFISWIIVYGLVYAMFTTDGPVNAVLGLFGQSQKLLTDKKSVYVFMCAIWLWKVLGWNSIIYVAAIAGIDQELYDAAKIDGAGRVGCALHVTLPGILPTMLVLLLMGIADFFTNSMDQMLVFENAFNTKNITTLELYTYKQGLKLMDYSYATAVGIMMSIVSITLLFATNWIAKRVRGSSIV